MKFGITPVIKAYVMFYSNIAIAQWAIPPPMESIVDGAERINTIIHIV